MNVRSLGDPMKVSISIWYDFSHNGVDVGRIARARWVWVAGWACVHGVTTEA